MADNDTFRVDKRPITSSEVNAQDTLNKIQEFRGQIDQPQPNPAVQVSGAIPPAFQQALGMANPMAPPVQQMPQNQERGPKQRPNAAPSFRVTQSSKFEELLSRIKDSTSIYEEIMLPSLGKFYDGSNGPVDGKLHVRQMTGEEEQILATSRFVKKGQAVNMIFNRCMKENFKSENFLTADRTYLLIYLRGISYTPYYDVEVKCPNCDRKFSTTIDLNSLWLDRCPNDFTTVKLHDVLPTTGFNFSYRLSTGSDEQQVQDYRDMRIKEFDLSNQSDDTLIYRTAMLINEIEDCSDKHELQLLIKNLPINDVAYLRNVVNDPPFGVDTKVEIPCPGCLQDFEMELPLESNFFFPRGKKKVQ